MEWYYYILIVIVGVFCGFLNTLAGSGSIISLAMLMFMGLPANVANGTNRIAILMQNIVGVSSFKKQKVFSFKEGIWLALPAIVGSVIGAGLAVEINEDMMQKTIGGLLIFLFFIVLYKPDAWVKGQAGLIRSKPSIIQIVIMFQKRMNPPKICETGKCMKFKFFFGCFPTIIPIMLLCQVHVVIAKDTNRFIHLVL